MAASLLRPADQGGSGKGRGGGLSSSVEYFQKSPAFVNGGANPFFFFSLSHDASTFSLDDWRRVRSGSLKSLPFSPSSVGSFSAPFLHGFLCCIARFLLRRDFVGWQRE